MDSIRNLFVIIKSKFDDSNNRDLVNNTIALTILNAFNFVLPIITIPILLNNLGASSYGIVNIYISFYAILQTVVDYGFDFVGTRDISLINESEKEKRNIIFSEITSCKLVNAVLSTSISLLYFYLFQPDNFLVAVLISLGLIGTAFNMNWLFQGLKKMKVITIITSTTKIVYSLLIILLIKGSDDILIYASLYSLTTVVIGFLGVIIAARAPYKVKFIRISFSNIIRSYKEGWHMFVANICSSLSTNLSTVILGVLKGEDAVAYFSAGYKIVQALSLVFSAITKALYPFSCSKFKNTFSEGDRYVRKIMKPVLFVIGFSCVILSIMSPYLFRWIYDDVYWIFYPVAIIGSIWLFLGFLNNFLGIQILVASGNSSRYRKMFSISTIITILSYYIFIPHGGVYGTISALLLGEFILMLLLRKQITKIRLLTKA